MIFYFDEAYHDKAITYKNDTINLEKNNVEEFYVGCYIGSDEWEDIGRAVLELEQKYKKTLGTNSDAELKSTALLKMSQLQHGLASLSKKSLDFYKELFAILSGKVRIHFSILNKYEYLIKECMPSREWFSSHGAIYPSFVYSFTKFMILHPVYDFPSILFSKRNAKWKVKAITDVFLEHAKKIKGIDKKKTELNAVNSMIQIIKHPDFYLHNIPEKLHWSYEFSPQLFHLYCDETGIKPDCIYVDNEENTVKALKKEFDFEVTGVDSKQRVEIRICDWIAGFFSRMLLSYDKDYKNDKENDLTENIHYLDEQFFRDDDAFSDFMKVLYDLFIIQQEAYWATGGTVYSDQTVCFYTFLRYYDYCRVNDKAPNASDFNSMLTEELSDNFVSMMPQVFRGGNI